MIVEICDICKKVLARVEGVLEFSEFDEVHYCSECEPNEGS